MIKKCWEWLISGEKANRKQRFWEKILKNKQIKNSNFFKSIYLKHTFIKQWLHNCLSPLSQGNNWFPITPLCDSAKFIRTSSVPFYAPIQPELIAPSNATTALLIRHFKARILFRFRRFRRQITRQSSGIGRFQKTQSSLAGSESCLCDPRLTPCTRNALTSTSKSWG